MKTIILYIVKKWLTPKKVAELVAGIIANLLRKASKSGKWDLIREIVKKVEVACSLFNEVYEDESLSKEDEEKIATAIDNLSADTISSILKKADIML